MIKESECINELPEYNKAFDFILEESRHEFIVDQYDRLIIKTTVCNCMLEQIIAEMRKL